MHLLLVFKISAYTNITLKTAFSRLKHSNTNSQGTGEHSVLKLVYIVGGIRSLKSFLRY